MKAISASVTRGLATGSRLRCADNSGATELEIIAVKGFHGVKRRYPGAGVGSWIICAVKKGNPKMKHQVVQAVIVRQKKEYRRKTGMRIKFDDNAAVLINEKGDPRGTRIKGPIAKEVVERFSTVGKIASMVV